MRVLIIGLGGLLLAQPPPDPDIGLVKEKPLLLGQGPAAERAFLDSICDDKGQNVKYSRRGSVVGGSDGHVLDLFEVIASSGDKLNLFIDMYHPEVDLKALPAPKGLKRCEAATPVRATVACQLVLAKELEGFLGPDSTRKDEKRGKQCRYSSKNKKLQVVIEADFGFSIDTTKGVLSNKIGLSRARPVGNPIFIPNGMALNYFYTNGPAIGIYKGTGAVSIMLVTGVRPGAGAYEQLNGIAAKASMRF